MFLNTSVTLSTMDCTTGANHLINNDLTFLFQLSNIDWGGNTSHHKSVSGISLFLAGAPISYWYHFQSTISPRSTETEFIAASEARKMTLYIRSILYSLRLHQDSATPLYEDHTATIAMANSSKPTYRTRYIELRHFHSLGWHLSPCLWSVWGKTAPCPNTIPALP